MLKYFALVILGILAHIQILQGAVISGIVTDSTAQTPIKDAMVYLLSGDEFSGHQIKGSDTTDESGAYSFSVAAEGSYTVMVSFGSLYRSKHIDTVVLNDDIIINISLSKAVYTTVSGVITDSTTGAPVEGADVTIGNPPRSAVTAADGTFSIDSVSVGEQTYYVRHIRYEAKHSTVQLSSDPFSLTVKLALITYTSIIGVVRDSVTGMPLAGVKVRLKSSPGSTGIYDTTGSSGEYFFDNVQSGSPSLTFYSEGYRSRATTVTVAGTDPVTKDIALHPVVFVTLQGVVHDSGTGLPLAGAVVAMVAGRGERLDTTGADGVYSFDSVEATTQSFTVSSSGYATLELRIPVSRTNPDTCNFALSVITGVSDRVTLKESSGMQQRHTGDGFTISGLKYNDRIALYTLSGRCVYRAIVAQGTHMLQIPEMCTGCRAALIVRITSAGNTIVRKLHAIR